MHFPSIRVKSSDLSEFAMADSSGSRYYFNNVGTVLDLLYPNKAILRFKLNGKDERAILLAKMLTLDGKTPDDHKNLDRFLKTGDVIHFDCHIYDKGGGVGSGKDKCNYYVMRATKNSKDYDLRNSGSIGGSAAVSGVQNAAAAGAAGSNLMTIPIQRGNNVILGTGWVSELNPRKGVLTFDNGGHDERVLMLASKLYIFERRLGARQCLSDVLTEGDLVQFEAVPQHNEGENASGTSGNLYCTWFANLVWKGRRPPSVDEQTPGSAVPLGLNISQQQQQVSARRGSQEDDAAQQQTASMAPSPLATAPVFNGFVSENVVRGVGIIARILNEKSGIVWWLKSRNNFQSVWFEAKQSFLCGVNLAEKNFFEVFKDGDPVTFIAERPPPNFPTFWVAKQVQVTDGTHDAVHGFLNGKDDDDDVEGNGNSQASSPE